MKFGTASRRAYSVSFSAERASGRVGLARGVEAGDELRVVARVQLRPVTGLRENVVGRRAQRSALRERSSRW